MDEYDGLAIAMAQAERGIQSEDARLAVQANMAARGKDTVMLIDSQLDREYPPDDEMAQILLKKMLRTKSIIRITREDEADKVTCVCVVETGPTVPDDTTESFTRTLVYREVAELPRKIAAILKTRGHVVVMGDNAPPVAKRGPGRPPRADAAT